MRQFWFQPFRFAEVVEITSSTEMCDIVFVCRPVRRVLCEAFSVLECMEIRYCAVIRTFAGYRYIIHFGQGLLIFLRWDTFPCGPPRISWGSGLPERSQGNNVCLALGRMATHSQ